MLAIDQDNYPEAFQKIGEAMYIQSGLDIIVDKNIRYYQERMPPYCKKTLEIITPIIDTIIKQRVELRYEF